MADSIKQKTAYPITYWFAIFMANATGHIPVHTIRHALYKYVFNVKMGKGSIIYCGCRFLMPSGVYIGKNSVIGDRTFLDGRKGLHIGDNVNIASEARLCSKDFKIICPHLAETGAPVVIKDRVHIGSRVTVLPGVTIGEGAFVLPGSVVREDVKPWTVVEGVPAKYVEDRPVHNYQIDTSIRAYFQ